MFYSIRHVTKFEYSNPVCESLMEVRMHPRTEGPQRCLSFELFVAPRARIHSYQDHLGNVISHFDIPGKHTELKVTAKSLIELAGMTELPDHLSPAAWDELDSMAATGDYWDMLMPSQFARPSEALASLVEPLKIIRRDDPLSFLRELNAGIYRWFDYESEATRVDSPIDHAIQAQKGVCQDFAHIMIALVRHVRIPCRYVSGYLYHRTTAPDRSSEGATHAWIEALLPRLGWVGFDPTNNLVAGERHIRTAIGRDYADVPPTKGFFRGEAESRLGVSVRISPSDAPVGELELVTPFSEWQGPPPRSDDFDQQQQ